MCVVFRMFFCFVFVVFYVCFLGSKKKNSIIYIY